MAMNERKQQLQMIWPESRLDTPPDPRVTDGYELRPYRPGDEPEFFAVMDAAGFTGWNEEKLRPWLHKILPDGWFMVAHLSSGQLVATAMATHGPSDLHPFGGELGWVAGRGDHAGKGLGRCVCAAATERFLRGGYKRIYLKTDDFRLPAIMVYLKLGYVPFLHAPDMEGRWQKVCDELGWKMDEVHRLDDAPT